MIRRFSFLFFLCLPILVPPAQADIEPSLGDLIPVYLINDIEGAGNVQILKESQPEWRDAKIGDRLEEGDRIRLGDETEAVLSLKSETLVHLDEDTEMGVSQLEENQTNGFLSRLKLWTGSVLSDVKKNLSESNSQFEVNAGGVVCGVRGTVFEVVKNGDNVETTTHEGVVDVKTPQGTQQVKAGNTCSTGKGGSSSVHHCGSAMKARFQAWKSIQQNLSQKSDRSHGNQNTHASMLGRSPSRGGKGANAGGKAGTHAAPPSHGGGHR